MQKLPQCEKSNNVPLFKLQDPAFQSQSLSAMLSERKKSPQHLRIKNSLTVSLKFCFALGSFAIRPALQIYEGKQIPGAIPSANGLVAGRCRPVRQRTMLSGLGITVPNRNFPQLWCVTLFADLRWRPHLILNWCENWRHSLAFCPLRFRQLRETGCVITLRTWVTYSPFWKCLFQNVFIAELGKHMP